jgi:hypothetical protein
MRTHVFQADPDNGPDHRGRYRCQCGLPEQHEAHQVPETPVEAQVIDARRIGEGNEDVASLGSSRRG